MVMNETALKISEEKIKLPVGVSKLFGNPDVWDGFVWPHFIINREEYDLSFVCQINCADTVPYDESGLLPTTGILYFFYDMDEMPSESSDDAAVRVSYFNGDLSALHEMLRIDHDGSDMSLREMKIHFEPSGNNGTNTPVRLGGVPVQGLQPVLQINSFETDKLNIRFEGGGSLCFFMYKSDLERRDFTKIFVRQIPADGGADNAE
jgi:uncharacterized protein YwqG